MHFIRVVISWWPYPRYSKIICAWEQYLTSAILWYLGTVFLQTELVTATVELWTYVIWDISPDDKGTVFIYVTNLCLLCNVRVGMRWVYNGALPFCFVTYGTNESVSDNMSLVSMNRCTNNKLKKFKTTLDVWSLLISVALNGMCSDFHWLTANSNIGFCKIELQNIWIYKSSYN